MRRRAAVGLVGWMGGARRSPRRTGGCLAALVALSISVAPAPAAGASAPPTLGVASAAPTGAGFGQVRPSAISYGGDPTSSVSRVRWRSWGGTRAVGHGVADWVWPGWCVACGSVELPATVVAFGRTSCDGHPAYARVEWYFPSRGMSFDRRLAIENLCGGKLLPVAPDRTAHCGRVRLGAGTASATHITQYVFLISCAAVRRFVASSGAARYARRNARFEVGAWWCGSELSMSLGGAQSFSCVRGDFTNVSFDLSPG